MTTNAPTASIPKSAAAPAQSTPANLEHGTKEEPGYGEEPDTAAPPTTFDDFNGGTADSAHDQNDQDQEDTLDDNYNHSAAGGYEDEPLQMKDDG